MEVQGKGKQQPNITQSERPRSGPTAHPHRLHREFTEDAQRTRKELTDDSQRTHRGLAEDSHRTHR